MSAPGRFFSRANGIVALALYCALAAPAQESPGPSAVSRALRALGLETPPGVRGDKAYREGNYEEALRHYGKAVEEADTATASRRLLDLNIGNALYRQERYKEAADYYARALMRAGRDSAFASRGHHNTGNTHYRRAEGAFKADSTKLEPVIADMREAVAHYKKALRLDPKAQRSKQNLEMAGALLKNLLARQAQQPPGQGDPPKPPEPSARAKEALARALQLAQERRYADADAVLNDIMRTDRTAASFAAHRKRLDDVMKIMRGERPDDPQPRDPRATPWSPGAPRGRATP